MSEPQSNANVLVTEEVSRRPTTDVAWEASDPEIVSAIAVPMQIAPVDYPQLTRSFRRRGWPSAVRSQNFPKEFYCQYCHFTWGRTAPVPRPAAWDNFFLDRIVSWRGAASARAMLHAGRGPKGATRFILITALKWLSFSCCDRGFWRGAFFSYDCRQAGAEIIAERARIPVEPGRISLRNFRRGSSTENSWRSAEALVLLFKISERLHPRKRRTARSR